MELLTSQSRFPSYRTRGEQGMLESLLSRPIFFLYSSFHLLLLLFSCTSLCLIFLLYGWLGHGKMQEQRRKSLQLPNFAALNLKHRDLHSAAKNQQLIIKFSETYRCEGLKILLEMTPTTLDSWFCTKIYPQSKFNQFSS